MFRKSVKTEEGFTLIELLVVIAIIGVLATLAQAAYNYARNQAKIVKAMSDADQIAKAITVLGNDTLVWPGGQAVDKVGTTPGTEICSYTPDNCTYGLSSDQTGLTETDGSYIGWSGPYMVAIPKDPWGNEYFFDTHYQIKLSGEPCDGDMTCVPAAVVGSYGPNGRGNKMYDNDDVIRILFK
ncbi:prepilin-type N-terminal cleavage/methylation domain-containing protein [Candidatus Falkowbacteria bacterium]|nr:prepilin-type N-terminal cleavage/methylation domain-containing protein [Candidatus Falkowbacteria bacterium]